MKLMKILSTYTKACIANHPELDTKIAGIYGQAVTEIESGKSEWDVVYSKMYEIRNLVEPGEEK